MGPSDVDSLIQRTAPAVGIRDPASRSVLALPLSNPSLASAYGTAGSACDRVPAARRGKGEEDCGDHRSRS